MRRSKLFTRRAARTVASAITSRAARTVASATVGGVLLAACGTNRPITLTYKHAKPAPGDASTLWIYSSLPMSGPRRAEALQIIDGINLELKLVKHRAGQHAIRYMPLNDAGSRGWSPRRTLHNALAAARNQNTVAYIGDLDSSATMLSLPILNQAGIVQITPGSPYPGLTNALPAGTRITGPNEPDRFYPQHQDRTLLRQIPSDIVQAAAVLDQLRSLDCRRVSAVSFGGGIDGPTLTRAIAATAKLYGITYVPPAPLGARTSTYATWAADLRAKAVGCFVLTGTVTANAIALTKVLHLQLPSAPILGTYGLCNSRWTSPRRNGVPTDADAKLYCTSPLFPVTPAIYPGANAFRGDFHRTFGRHAKLEPYALYGFLAAEMVVNTAEILTNAVDSRQELLNLLIRGRPQNSAVMGHSYTFDPAGNINSNRYALYRVVDGHPKYWKPLTPPHLLPRQLRYASS